MPLFPSISDLHKVTAETSVREWLYKAHAVAAADLRQRGVPEQSIKQWLSGEIMYGYRNRFATRMDKLGYGWTEAEQGEGSEKRLHKYCAFLGDWALPGAVMSKIYAKLDPRILAQIVEFRRAKDVLAMFSQEEEESEEEAMVSIYEEAWTGAPIPLRHTG